MEILYEGSLEKCFHPQDLRKDWRKRYFVLKRALGGGIMALEYYKDKDWKRLEPKGVLTLYTEFTVRKLNDLKKRFAFEVATVDNHFLLAALTDEARTQWCEMLETNMSVKSFEVTLEDCHSLSTLGCPSGTHCFLQISDSDLALKTSGSQLVVWPFSCIRRYKCRDCIFVVEVGRKAPSGEGIFCFRTPKHQQVFETLDKAVKERMKSKDANISSDFAELIPTNQALSSAVMAIRENKVDGQTTRFEQQQPQDEYNHLDFAIGSRGMHSPPGKMTSPGVSDLYNHLASATPFSRRENHRASDFGLAGSSDLSSGKKLSKSMSSLISIASGDSLESDYANLDSDRMGRENHVSQLKKAIERQVSSQDYVTPRLSPVGFASPPGQLYDRLRGGLVGSPPDSNRNPWPNSHPRPNRSLSVENEYDSLNTGRDHRAFSPSSEVNSPTEGLYNHLQEGSNRIASPGISAAQTHASPPKPSFKELIDASTTALKRCPGPQEEDENVYCVPREPTIAPASMTGPLSGLASSPSPNPAPRVAPKPASRPKPTLPLPLAGISNIPASSRKPPFNSRIGEVNSPEKLASSAGSSPASNEVILEDSSHLKSPINAKASTKPALYPGGGIGQAIAQAGLVAQLKKSLVVGSFNVTEGGESGQQTRQDPAVTITSQKASQGISGKSQPVYAVSPFGKEEVEAAENEYINIEHASKGLSMTQYDKVGSIVEGDYYEAMNARSGYDEVGATVPSSHGEVIYDVPRGEGIY